MREYRAPTDQEKSLVQNRKTNQQKYNQKSNRNITRKRVAVARPQPGKEVNKAEKKLLPQQQKQ